jgi:uncharacterized protein (TIGR03437 family)
VGSISRLAVTPVILWSMSLLGAFPAFAATVTITITGTVQSGTDFSGVFGSASANLAGQSYTLVFTFDDTKGKPFSQSCVGGPVYETALIDQGGQGAGTATLRIGSGKFQFGGGFLDDEQPVQSQAEISAPVGGPNPCGSSTASYYVVVNYQNAVNASDYSGSSYVGSVGVIVRPANGTVLTADPNWEHSFTNSKLDPATTIPFNINLTAQSGSPANYHASGSLIPSSITVSGTGAPAITSVQNGASFQNGFAIGAWMTIDGTNLSAVTDTWDQAIMNGQLPTSLDGVKVSVGSQPAYVAFVSPSQINVVAPNAQPGPASVTITNAQGTSGAFSATAQTYQPAFFLVNNTYAVATRQDFSLALKNGTIQGVTTVPAKPGDVIILWGTGFGPSSPPAPIGVEVPANSYPAAAPVTVTVGNQPATVYGAALAPGFAALYQVAVQIPTSLTDGDYSVVATVGGQSSPTTSLITVKH